jgi:hypothetical protein
MATYEVIQAYVKQNYGYTPKTCWIAHVKEICDLNPRVAANRIDNATRQNPCPEDKQNDIISSFWHFHMI